MFRAPFDSHDSMRAGSHPGSSGVQPVRVSRSIPRGARVVQDIEADHCVSDLDHREDAKRAVMSTLHADATELGADGIARVELDTRIATAFLDTCWNRVTATAVAYKFP
jgi:uncharacterized protein YbjQ (UPF0145 family)